MDIAAESHIHRAHFVMNESSFLSPGQNPCRTGKMNAIPATAAYDSWNPISVMLLGDSTICIIIAVIITRGRLILYFLKFAYSPMVMKVKALIIDGPEPVASV